jgi:hypothetical protein
MMNSLSARDSLPVRCLDLCRRDQAMGFPVLKHVAEVIKIAIERCDIDAIEEFLQIGAA